MHESTMHDQNLEHFIMQEPVLLCGDDDKPLKAFSLGTSTLYPVPQLARFVLRAHADGLKRAASAWGLEVPAILRASSSQDRHLLWQGPDEYLLLALVRDVDEIKASLAAVMDGHPYSLVEVSHRNQAFLLTGERVEQLLATGLMLDLSVHAFPVGMTTRTLFAKADITLWRKDLQTFHVEIGRSFAPYMIGLLKSNGMGLD